MSVEDYFDEKAPAEAKKKYKTLAAKKAWIERDTWHACGFLSEIQRPTSIKQTTWGYLGLRLLVKRQF